MHENGGFVKGCRWSAVAVRPLQARNYGEAECSRESKELSPVESPDRSSAMAAPRNYTDTPRWRDLQAMLTPVAVGSGVGLLLILIYSFVRFA
jgi:hypothetical protein